MKNLVHEIHRRSLWQVLGLYLAGSWVALQVVEQLTEAAGLPEWVRPFSLVLLVLGFPIVMATAFIQEGVGGRRTAEVAGSEATPAMEGESETAAAADAPSAAPSRASTGRRLFTWRNAVVGGVAAFAIMALLTVGYLVMRTTGVGPAGTLVARGVLEEGAPVVLSVFDSPDEGLAEVVSGALRIDLFQSPTIRVVDPNELGDALRRMERDASTPITATVARELAEREGYGAIIEGEIGTVGSGYVLTARIVGGANWAPLAAFRETARSEDDLIDAIEALSRSIRDKSGESLRTVQSGPPLESVTTGSLEALRLYTRGEAIAGDFGGQAELFERAIELDPAFAMAHRKLGVALGNQGVRQADQVIATTRAYELRDRLPDVERYLAEADYEELILGDRDAAIRAFENLLELDPLNNAALNNLGLLYHQRGRLEEAEDLFVRAVDATAVGFEVAYSNLARVRFSMGRADAANAALDSGLANLPEAALEFERVRVLIAHRGRDYDRAEELAGGFVERFSDPTGRRVAANLQYQLAAVAGRLAEAERHVDDFDLAPGFTSHPMVMATARARVRAARGEALEAIRDLVSAYEAVRDSLDGAGMVYEAWLPELLDLGGADEAAAIYEEWKRASPAEEIGAFGRDVRRALDAQFAFHEGRVDESLRLWDAFERECPGACGRRAAIGRARVHDETGDATAAIADYEAYVTNAHWNEGPEDAFALAPVLERLGQLYDEQADSTNASRRYTAFVDLWAGADEVLQPRVRAAEARLAELRRASQ
jgi:tetratricopeptide (TPR) repeat protein